MFIYDLNGKVYLESNQFYSIFPNELNAQEVQKHFHFLHTIVPLLDIFYKSQYRNLHFLKEILLLPYFVDLLNKNKYTNTVTTPHNNFILPL